jgi:hypothetical protein
MLPLGLDLKRQWDVFGRKNVGKVLLPLVFYLDILFL